MATRVNMKNNYNNFDKNYNSDSDSELEVVIENINQVMNLRADSFINGESDNENLLTMRKKSDHRTRNLIIFINILIAQFVLYIIFISVSDKIELFTWHPPLMTFGWTFLFAQGILTFVGDNCFMKYVSHKTRIRLHWIFQSTSILCICTGFLIVFVNKNIKDKQHFATWHAQVGLVTLISLFFTTIIGIAALYSVKLKTVLKPIINKTFHAISGISTYFLGSVATILGFYSQWFEERTNYYVQIMCTGLIIFVLLSVLFKPAKNTALKLKVILK